MAEAMVARFETNMKADEVEGTPTLFINGTKLGVSDWAGLETGLKAAGAR